MRLIKISSQDYQTCVKFSEDVDTQFYETRKQLNDEKRKKDSLIGKLGEIGTFKALKDKLPNLTEPDFLIYKASEKSWDFDLKADGVNIHVKTQDVEQGKKYGESWVFQKQDKHIFKEYSEFDYVAFVSIDLKTRECFIRSILPVSLLHEKSLFKQMKLFHLSSKCAIYYDDIKDIESKWV